jgi:deazaflavin-dependent oxidoreductase (nitroreductase family)
MPQKISVPKPPRGILKLLLRLPIWLYQAHLGRLLGKRFLMVEHIGRKSGEIRQTVLEVVGHERDTGVYYVASGFGEKSDWLLNIRENPIVTIHVAGSRFRAGAERLHSDKAGDVLMGYARAHPLAMRELMKILGYRLNGSEADIRASGSILPVVAFRPD